MDAIITQLQDVVEGQIDFDGQRVTDLLSTVLLILTSIVALIVGFVLRDIHLVLWIVLAGTFSTMLIVVPPWPSYNQHKQPWVGSRAKLQAPRGGLAIGGTKVN